jgi:transcriptional antiterminator RfaH
MPLLPLEPFVYPADLLTAPGGRAPDRWWVLHTRASAEKVLARNLMQLRHAFFLPLYKKQWRRCGRMLTSYVPLFPGYLFLRGEEAARLAALRTKRVVRALEVPDQDRLGADLAGLYRLMETGSPLAPEECLRPGMPVVLTAGPLTGLQGKVIRRNKRLQFVIEVDFIQRGTSVEVEGWMLQPLGPAPAVAAGT